MEDLNGKRVAIWNKAWLCSRAEKERADLKQIHTAVVIPRAAIAATRGASDRNPGRSKSGIRSTALINWVR